MKWSAPYHGVQHLVEGLPGPARGQRRYQATVTDYGSFSEAYILQLPEARQLCESRHETPEAARVWIESKVPGLV